MLEYERGEHFTGIDTRVDYIGKQVKILDSD